MHLRAVILSTMLLFGRNISASEIKSPLLMNTMAPEQIHLALGATPDYMAVQWATMDTFCTGGSDAQYGIVPDDLPMMASGACFPFDLGTEQVQQSNHWVNMTGLTSRTTYYYRVGDAVADNWSEVYHFRAAVDGSDISSALPQRFLVWGDLGTEVPDSSATVMPYTSLEVQKGDIDMILHLGDFAYDLDSHNGKTGRRFMNDIQNMSAYVPYMVDVGNHESGYNYAHYTEFFRSQPSDTPWVSTDNGDAPNNWWFSWNIGLVHFAAISSEIQGGDLNPIQWAWLEADLKKANENRTQAPWIVVHAHKSIYCSCDGDCDDDATLFRAGEVQADGSYLYGYENLFYEYGVDLFLNGHEHNYERMYDIAPAEDGTYLAGVTTMSTTDMPATTYIVTGIGGGIEAHESFTRPKPNRTAFRTDAYSYSRMDVYNATHLHWQQVECDSSEDPGNEGAVIDDVWLVQHEHGSFARASKATATKTAV